MCVLIAILHVLYTFWCEECWWFFQLNGNSCFWVMCLMEVEGAACFYLLWPQPWKGNTSNVLSLPSDAKASGQTFFGFLKQNTACNTGSWVSVGKTRFVLGTAGPTAGILQVSTFQLEALHPIMGGKRKLNRFTSAQECVDRLLDVLALSWVVLKSPSVGFYLCRITDSDFCSNTGFVSFHLGFCNHGRKPEKPEKVDLSSLSFICTF